MRHGKTVLLLLILVGVAAAASGCTDDDEDPTGPAPSGLEGTWVGTGYFGFAGTPQPITIRIDSDGASFGGSVTTANVPDGPMTSGSWDGAKARWKTAESGIESSWESERTGDTLSGFTTGMEFSFTSTRQ